LLGVVNPSGRLAETLPLRLEDNPAMPNFPGEEGHVRYGEGIFVGYRGYDALRQQVSYPFGHGLSYTGFDYTDLSAAGSGRPEDGDLAIEVTCRVTNTGDCAGKEVVQLYVGDPEASVARPVRELKAFAKVDLAPGEVSVAAFRLSARDLSFWSTRTHGWVLEGGMFELAVGASSRDLRLTTTVDVEAPPLSVPLDGSATLEEWLADPDGRALLIKEIGTDENGKPNGILGDEERVRRIGNFPLNRLAAFPGMGITHDTLRALTAVVDARRGLSVRLANRAVRRPDLVDEGERRRAPHDDHGTRGEVLGRVAVRGVDWST
jgi:beta-glucosidase